jgi:hypothetical protein
MGFITAQDRVAPPTPLPRTTGVLSVVPMREENGPWAYGGATFDSVLCGFARYGDEKCGGPAVSKTFDAPSWGSAEPFWIYDGVKCDLLNTERSYEDIARERLIAGASTAIERGIVVKAFQPFTDPAATPAVSGGVVGATTGTQTALAALGQVEQALSERYAGQGIVHMDLVTAYDLIGQQALHFDPLTSTLRTILGTPVVIGAGYDLYRTRTGGPFNQAFSQAFATAQIGGSAIANRWIFGTGAMEILMTPVVTSVAYDTANNDKYALAERVVAALIDCDLVVAAKIAP